MRLIIRSALVLLATLAITVIGALIAFWAPDVPVDVLKVR